MHEEGATNVDRMCISDGKHTGCCVVLIAMKG